MRMGVSLWGCVLVGALGMGSDVDSVGGQWCIVCAVFVCGGVFVRVYASGRAGV